VSIDGNVKLLVSATLYRNPNPLQRDRGIYMRAGHTQERLFPPLRGHTINRYRSWAGIPGKLWNISMWKYFNMMVLAEW